MQWFAQAPSNIALIKYMGKMDGKENLPINPSLSYTLHNLLSSVVLEEQAGKKDFWEPLNIPGALPFTLGQYAQERFLQHLQLLKQSFNYSGAFVVRSSNNFPHSSGLASSASSFAALTKCAVLALCELTKSPILPIETQAQLSRLGSGSSCRSFFSPWALWRDKNVMAVDLPYSTLIHQVVIISHEEKEVSSSKAHLRIRTSPLYQTRAQQAEKHLSDLMQAFEEKNWKQAFIICWEEFQALHELFATSVPSFSYITPECKMLLTTLQKLWERNDDGPIVTMDAGPNIHLLYRPDQAELALQFKNDYLIGNFDVL